MTKQYISKDPFAKRPSNRKYEHCGGKYNNFDINFGIILTIPFFSVYMNTHSNRLYTTTKFIFIMNKQFIVHSSIEHIFVFENFHSIHYIIIIQNTTSEIIIVFPFGRSFISSSSLFF